MLDRAAAGFGQPHHDIGLERLGRGRHFVERYLEGRLAVGIGVGQVGERQALDAELILCVPIVEAEHIAREAGPFGRLGDVHLAVDGETGGGRAIEEAAVERDLGGTGGG